MNANPLWLKTRQNKNEEDNNNNDDGKEKKKRFYLSGQKTNSEDTARHNEWCPIHGQKLANIERRKCKT